jgi:hypothetical protein
VVHESGDRVWAFRFTDLEGKRAQMEFAKADDRDSASGQNGPRFGIFTGSGIPAPRAKSER